ncbi:UDP-glucose dehydrogenase family protein [Syntrophotalea acetylenica]|jgi:UDPglucose 6-dehydrogenase|uniref:UDP-glucose 6-dehydrogenase n=1 Tax=Syntrophotalea acetylenica TaxID=29542 RepID=A0A1L3GIC2_SYNAC|nr:UDP-glucose/GDP-mannose dehydrogenase family protein [Syntrophotalea acetylenica]APG25659.1 UDP-glucose 6-dehydrogenase [Syntrophotalea acetylenica]APG43731.1 UDP-glucose 6-dehydrogenase [Syntrophotalea acetylenica]
MNLTVIGTGYVGLVTGTCFAEMGNTVTCVDTDPAKVAQLGQGQIPIFEPGLDAMVKNNSKDGRLRFTTSLAEAMADSQIYFIAVGTPSNGDGSADLRQVLAVAREIGRHLNAYGVVVDKSTVPVGTAEKVREAIQGELQSRGVNIDFDVVSNPEFLKEGAAIDDFMRPDRIIVGSDSDRAREIMRQLYAPFNMNRDRTLYMGVRDAEMTKYAANAMLATKISFINEIAGLCDRLDVDVENVRLGIGSDARIGYSFIYPGCGYGGSCFPKDVKAIIHLAESCRFEPRLLRSVEERNQAQRRVLCQKVRERFGDDLSGLTFGVWGLAFKPGTDDLREAPAVVLLHELIGAGAKVRAYDPVAMDAARRQLPAAWFDNGDLVLCEHQYHALQDVDAMILVTEWKPFRTPDFHAMRKLMKQPVIFDGRNQYEPQTVKQAGFEYQGIGRKS